MSILSSIKKALLSNPHSSQIVNIKSIGMVMKKAHLSSFMKHK
jgi:hypothetical protein